LKIWISAFATVVLLSFVPAKADDATGSKASWTIGKYRVVVESHQPDEGMPKATLQIFDGAKRVYRRTDGMLNVNPAAFFVDFDQNADYDQTIKPYKVGEDILGLGAPTLAVQGFTGGAHCCFSLTVLVLGETVRALPTIDLLDAETVRFKPLKPGAPLSFTTNDFTFGYWWAPFSDSAAAPVVLSYDPARGRYDADADLMRAPAPTPKELDDLAAAAIAAEHQTLKDGQSFVPYDLTQPILKLIYTGHIADARAVLDKAWIGPPKYRDLYWSDLTECQLRKSAYWPVVAQLNGLPAAAPIPPCPRKEPDKPLGRGQSTK